MSQQFPKPGWETEWLVINDQEVSFNLHRCFNVQQLLAYGMPELTPIYCDLDSYLYMDISPHIRFNRTQTIAIDGEYCDFKFLRTPPEENQ